MRFDNRINKEAELLNAYRNYNVDKSEVKTGESNSAALELADEMNEENEGKAKKALEAADQDDEQEQKHEQE